MYRIMIIVSIVLQFILTTTLNGQWIYELIHDPPPIVIPNDTLKVNFFNLFWQINPEHIWDQDTEHEYFYKAIAFCENGFGNILYRESTDQNNPFYLQRESCECAYHLYLMKGEYGEYPDGVIYDIGKFYGLRDVSFDLKDSVMIVKYGAADSLRTYRRKIDLNPWSRILDPKFNGKLRDD